MVARISRHKVSFEQRKPVVFVARRHLSGEVEVGSTREF